MPAHVAGQAIMRLRPLGHGNGHPNHQGKISQTCRLSSASPRRLTTLQQLFAGLHPGPPIVPLVVLRPGPEQNTAVTPRVEDKTVMDRPPHVTDDHRMVNDPELGRGRDGPMDCQRAKTFLLQTFVEVFGPMIAKPAFTIPLIDLGIMDDRRVGDVVFFGKLQRIAVGDARGALCLSGVNAWSKTLYLQRQSVNITRARGWYFRASADDRNRQHNHQ